MVPNNWEDQRGRYKGFLAPRPWYTQEPTLNLPTMEARMNSADEFGALPMVSAGKYGKSPSADRLGPIRFAADRACLVTKAQVPQEVLGRVAPLVGCVQKSALWSSTEHCLFLWAVWIFRIRGLRLLLRNDGWELTIKDHFHRSLWRLRSRQNLLAVLQGANQHAYFRNSAVVKQMTWSFSYSDRGHIIGLCSLPRLLTRDWINRLRNIKTKEASAFATAHIRTQTQQFYVPAQVHAIHLLNRFCLFRKKKSMHSQAALAFDIMLFFFFHAFLHRRAFCFYLLSNSLFLSATDAFSVIYYICLLYASSYPLCYSMYPPPLSQIAIGSLSLVHVYESWKVLRVSSALFL